MPRPQRILFIRHGESAANTDYSCRSRTPDHKIPLTEKGCLQARTAGAEIAKILNGEKVATYISPFLRTRQTAEELMSQIPSAQLDRTREDPRIREQEWGNYQNFADINRIDKERKEFGIFFYRLPMGESGADVYDRVTTFLDTLYRDFEKPDYPPNALIVTHGLTLRLLLMRWLHWSVETFEDTRNPRNCEFFQMSLDASGHYQLSEPFPMKEKEEAG